MSALAIAPADVAYGPRPRSGAIRVLIGADTYAPDVNGAAYFAHRLAAGLAGRGHDVHVVCPSSEGLPEVEYRDGVIVHRVRSWPIPRDRRMRFAQPFGLTDTLGELIDRIGPDVVHVQAHFLVGRALIRAARRTGVPIVATNHFMPDNLMHHARIPAWLRNGVARTAWRDAARVFAGADHVTAPTETAARLFRDRGFPGDVEAVSCGIDLRRFAPGRTGRAAARARLGLPDRDTVLFVGRLDEEKRLDEAVRAVAALRGAGTDVQLALVGTGPRRDSLAGLAESLGIADHVHLPGFVADELLPTAYAAADLFVMPGIAELQSIATLEAMSAGLPVVAADAVALPHLVRPGVNGYLFRPGDVAGLAGYLGVLLGDEVARRRMGHQSRAIAGEHDERRSLERFEELYGELAAGAGANGDAAAGARRYLAMVGGAR